MKTVIVERDYGASVETIFDWLANPTNYKWAAAIFSARFTRPGDDGEYRLGAIRTFRSPQCWWTEEVTVYERPYRFGYQVLRIFPPAQHHGATIDLAERGGRTHVRWMSSYSMPVPVVGGALERATFPAGRFYVRSILAAAAKRTEKTPS